MEMLPRLTLEAEHGDVALAQWRAATAMLFDSFPAEEPFRAGINSYSLGDLLFGASASVAHRFVRDEAIIARSRIDHLLFQLYLEGGFEGFADANACAVRQGDVVVFDLARSFVTEATRFANLNLVVPRRLLPLELRDRDLHGLVLTPDTAAGRILVSHMKSLWSVCENAAAEDAAEIVRATVALISAIVGDLGRDPAEKQGGDSTIRAEICRHVEANLGQRALDAQYICERFGVSRSTLYRLFDSIGGVATFIRNRRLDAAFDELSTLGRRSGRLDMLARKWGFASEDAFARAFKGRYGFNPNRMRRADVRGLAGMGQGDRVGRARTLSDWFRTIGPHVTAGSTGDAEPAPG